MVKELGGMEMENVRFWFGTGGMPEMVEEFVELRTESVSSRLGEGVSGGAALAPAMVPGFAPSGLPCGAIRAGWAIVELMGHRVCIGWAQAYQDRWVHVDVHAVGADGTLHRDEQPAFKSEYAPQAIYGLTWVSSDDAAQALSNRCFEIEPVDWHRLAPEAQVQKAVEDDLPF